MNTKQRVALVLVAVAALDVWALVSCAQRSRTAPAKEALAVGDIPGTVAVPPGSKLTRTADGQLQMTPTPKTDDGPPGSTTIAPMPVPGEDSARTAQRKIMNLPRFGDYVYVTELPEAIERAEPVYPAAARQAGVSGIVMVQALVLADGTVGDTRIVKSIPPLDEAAASCVRKWRFKPALNKDGPTAVWVGVPIRFDLSSR